MVSMLLADNPTPPQLSQHSLLKMAAAHAHKEKRELSSDEAGGCRLGEEKAETMGGTEINVTGYRRKLDTVKSFYLCEEITDRAGVAVVHFTFILPRDPTENDLILVHTD